MGRQSLIWLITNLGCAGDLDLINKNDEIAENGKKCQKTDLYQKARPNGNRRKANIVT